MSPKSGFRFSDLRHYIPYVLLIIFFIGGIWIILTAGARMDFWATRKPPVNTSAVTSLTQGFKQNFRNPVSVLLTQIIVIIAVAGLFSRLFRKMNQPPVMGEMIAGIIMGPSVLGFFFADAMAFLCPASSLETLRLLAQIGVVFFMFVVGMELNIQHVRERGSAAVMISHASIIVPLLLAGPRLL